MLIDYFSAELKSQYQLLEKLLNHEFIFMPGQTDQVNLIFELQIYLKYIKILMVTTISSHNLYAANTCEL